MIGTHFDEKGGHALDMCHGGRREDDLLYITDEESRLAEKTR